MRRIAMPASAFPRRCRTTTETVLKLVEPIIRFQSELQQIRRDLHAHPELCYEEQRTADVVAQS